jgi:truncated hemoglobin YjbI
MELYLCGKFAEDFLVRLKADSLLNKYFKDMFLGDEKFQSIISPIVAVINGTEINDSMKSSIQNAHIGMNISPLEFKQWLHVLSESITSVGVREQAIHNVIQKFDSLHHLVIEQEIVTNIQRDINKLEYMKKRASSEFTS